LVEPGIPDLAVSADRGKGRKTHSQCPAPIVDVRGLPEYRTLQLGNRE
jgi:hypothetical protein